MIGPTDRAAEFEEALRKRGEARYTLSLYVAGMTLKSVESVSFLRNLCDEHLPDRYDIEVIDIYQHPEMAKDQQIIAAPTLVKRLPPPPRKFIGRLRDRKRILEGLDINAKE